MKFCSGCGGHLALAIPPGDTHQRYICTVCEMIHYQNPRIVAGVIAENAGQILLCRRAIEPRRNYWTIPAGYMENGETIEQCARREAYEEAQAVLSELSAYAALDLPHIEQVYFIFRGDLQTISVMPGAESEETRFFKPEEIPWNDLAFQVVEEILRIWVTDRETGLFPFQMIEVRPQTQEMRALKHKAKGVE